MAYKPPDVLEIYHGGLTITCSLVTITLRVYTTTFSYSQ